jgi:DNA repair protein RecO
MSVRLEGIILRKKVLRDNDLLLSVFTLSDGRLQLLQKRGLKKPQAEIDLFCRNELIVSENKDFSLIYQVSGLDLFANIRQNYELLQEASEAVKISEKITSSAQANAGLYRLLLNYLRTLNSAIDTSALLNIRLELYRNILLNEGIYDGKKVTEKNFFRQIENYRG